MKFGIPSDLMRLVGVDAHIDPLLLAFGRGGRGGRPRAAVSDKGALRMRHTPCGCCPPTAPQARSFQPRFLSQHEKESAVDGRKKEWQRGDFDFPPLQSPLKRPRRGLMPPSWIIPGVWFVQSTFQISKKRDADADLDRPAR